MIFLSQLFAILAAIVLGLTAGALVAEGAVLVPFWRSQRPQAFLAWYRDNAALLFRFFGTLELGTVLIVIVALALSAVYPVATTYLLAAAALLAGAVLAAFPLYFRDVNSSFAAGTIAPDQVAGELRRWARWHWVRTGFAVAAFALSVLALGLR